MRNSTVAPGVRDLLAGAFGQEAVDGLSPDAVGRILGCLFGATRRELEQPNPDQLELSPPLRAVS